MSFFRTISTRIFYLKGHGQNFGEGNKIILKVGAGELDGPIRIWTKLDAGNFAWPQLCREVFLPAAYMTAWHLAMLDFHLRQESTLMLCKCHRSPAHHSRNKTPCFKGETTTHLRAGSYILSLAKEENYSIRSILPISFTLLTLLNILGTGWQIGYPIVQEATFIADVL